LRQLFRLVRGRQDRPGRAQPVGPADLEPDEIVGVVDHAHLVGFGIANTDVGRALGGRSRHQTRMPVAAALLADARRLRVAASASAEPKIALPATRMVAPAATISATLELSTPPSISMWAADPVSASNAFTRRTLS